MVSLSPMHLLLPVYQVYLPQLLYPGQVDSTLLHSKYRYSTQYTYRYSTHYTSTFHTVHSTHLNSKYRYGTQYTPTFQVQVLYTVHSTFLFRLNSICFQVQQPFQPFQFTFPQTSLQQQTTNIQQLQTSVQQAGDGLQQLQTSVQQPGDNIQQIHYTNSISGTTLQQITTSHGTILATANSIHQLNPAQLDSLASEAARHHGVG